MIIKIGFNFCFASIATFWSRRMKNVAVRRAYYLHLKIKAKIKKDNADSKMKRIQYKFEQIGICKYMTCLIQFQQVTIYVLS